MKQSLAVKESVMHELAAQPPPPQSPFDQKINEAIRETQKSRAQIESRRLDLGRDERVLEALGGLAEERKEH